MIRKMAEIKIADGRDVECQEAYPTVVDVRKHEPRRQAGDGGELVGKRREEEKKERKKI
jgi:hypothetical protein